MSFTAMTSYNSQILGWRGTACSSATSSGGNGNYSDQCKRNTQCKGSKEEGASTYSNILVASSTENFDSHFFATQAMPSKVDLGESTTAKLSFKIKMLNIASHTRSSLWIASFEVRRKGPGPHNCNLVQPAKNET